VTATIQCSSNKKRDAMGNDNNSYDRLVFSPLLSPPSLLLDLIYIFWQLLLALLYLCYNIDSIKREYLTSFILMISEKKIRFQIDFKFRKHEEDSFHGY
jgi:hypothetical protein